MFMCWLMEDAVLIGPSISAVEDLGIGAGMREIFRSLPSVWYAICDWECAERA